jgi:hypothetical protein
LLGLPPLFLPVLVGIISAMVLTFLLSAAEKGSGFWVLGFRIPKTQNPEPRTQNPSLPVGALSVLVILFTALFCTRFLKGYGVALGGLTMLLFFMATESLRVESFRLKGKGPEEEQPSSFISHPSSLNTLLSLISALIVAALLRVFLETYDFDDARISLYTHYNFLGLAAGILVPWCLSEMSDGQERSSLIRSAILMGFTCVALPLVIFIFWGIKAVVGLMAGLVFAQWLAALPAFSGTPERKRFPLNVLTFSIALVAIQFTHLLLTHEGSLTRLVRIRIVEVALALIVLALVGQAVKNRSTGQRVNGSMVNS